MFLMKYCFTRRDPGDAGSVSGKVISHLWSNWTSQRMRWSRGRADLSGTWLMSVRPSQFLTTMCWGLKEELVGKRPSGIIRSRLWFLVWLWLGGFYGRQTTNGDLCYFCIVVIFMDFNPQHRQMHANIIFTQDAPVPVFHRMHGVQVPAFWYSLIASML